ncbi:MAG: excisionase, partial [Oscillospiraceae bacterium]|nr:excisionase [Oscillospiraceae bacterium]
MNKNIELFDIEMDRGQAESISNTRQENQHLVPVFLTPKKNMGISRRDFNDWWQGRRIPASRSGIKDALWKINFEQPNQIGLDELAEKALGLSLSDQFWIRPSEDVKWEDVNFFNNGFSNDIGTLLISGEWNGGNLSSPDNTSDGVVKKKWKIVDGTRCLLKGSYGAPWQAQPFREVFASQIAKLLLGSEMVVPYSIVVEEQKGAKVYLSSCPNFVTTDTEYV